MTLETPSTAACSSRGNTRFPQVRGEAAWAGPGLPRRPQPPGKAPGRRHLLSPHGRPAAGTPSRTPRSRGPGRCGQRRGREGSDPRQGPSSAGSTCESLSSGGTDSAGQEGGLSGRVRAQGTAISASPLAGGGVSLLMGGGCSPRGPDPRRGGDPAVPGPGPGLGLHLCGEEVLTGGLQGLGEGQLLGPRSLNCSARRWSLTGRTLHPGKDPLFRAQCGESLP